MYGQKYADLLRNAMLEAMPHHNLPFSDAMGIYEIAEGEDTDFVCVLNVGGPHPFAFWTGEFVSEYIRHLEKDQRVVLYAYRIKGYGEEYRMFPVPNPKTGFVEFTADEKLAYVT